MFIFVEIRATAASMEVRHAASFRIKVLAVDQNMRRAEKMILHRFFIIRDQYFLKVGIKVLFADEVFK